MPFQCSASRNQPQTNSNNRRSATEAQCGGANFGKVDNLLDGRQGSVAGYAVTAVTDAANRGTGPVLGGPGGCPWYSAADYALYYRYAPTDDNVGDVCPGIGP